MQNTNKPFGWSDKIGYAFGDIANNFTFNFIAGFLMLFYTDVWGIDPKVVGGLFLASRIVDAFTDVGMGRIVDKFKGNKDGKFRPFIKWGAIPVAFAGFLIFQTGLKDMSMTFKLVYMYVSYILWGSFCYTFINIPYGSMASAVTTDPDQRTELSTFRTLGATVAGLTIGFITPMIIFKANPAGGEDILLMNRFPLVAGIYGVIAIISYMICFKGVTERVKLNDVKVAEDLPSTKGIGHVLLNRSLISVIVMAILLLLAMLLVGSMNAYIFRVYFENGKGMALAGLFAQLPMLITAPTAMKLGQKWGKKEASTFGFLFAAAVYLLLYILKVKNMYVFLVATSFAYFGLGIFNTLTWAMITDVIDDLEIKNGRRDDGTVYAIYSFARKLGQALAGGLGGFALTMVGYASGAATQTPEVAMGIYTVSTLIPALALGISGLVTWFIYPLDKKTVDKNVKILADKRA